MTPMQHHRIHCNVRGMLLFIDLPFRELDSSGKIQKKFFIRQKWAAHQHFFSIIYGAHIRYSIKLIFWRKNKRCCSQYPFCGIKIQRAHNADYASAHIVDMLCRAHTLQPPTPTLPLDATATRSLNAPQTRKHASIELRRIQTNTTPIYRSASVGC